MIGISSTRQYTPDDSSSSSSLSADDWYISLKSDVSIEPSRKLPGNRRRSRRSQGNDRNGGNDDDDSIASHDSMKLRHRCPRRTTRIPAMLSSSPKDASTYEGFSTMKRHVLPGKMVSSFQLPLCTTNVTTTQKPASIPSSITIVLPTLPPRNTPPAMRRRCPAAA